MPEAFLKCVRNGGRVRTISGKSKRFGLEKDEYMHVCFLNGEMFLGEKKKKKKGRAANAKSHGLRA